MQALHGSPFLDRYYLLGMAIIQDTAELQGTETRLQCTSKLYSIWHAFGRQRVLCRGFHFNVTKGLD